MRNQLFVLTAIVSLTVSVAAQGADWITAPSTYTHDPQTGQRVDQYSPIGPVYTYARPSFLRSGYRHTRSSIQAGNSADNMHIVEEWGRAVRPYHEWQLPFKPGSAPYSMWGAPFAGLGYPVPPYPFRHPFPTPYSGSQPGRQPGGR